MLTANTELTMELTMTNKEAHDLWLALQPWYIVYIGSGWEHWVWRGAFMHGEVTFGQYIISYTTCTMNGQPLICINPACQDALQVR